MSRPQNAPGLPLASDQDTLSAACPHCDAKPGQRCMALSDYARKPHRARQRLAWALAAHSDPALDQFWPRVGPCLVCGTPGLDQRHRVVDAIAGMIAVGEDLETVAREHGVMVEAVRAVEAWTRRWPGAWR